VEVRVDNDQACFTVKAQLDGKEELAMSG